MRQKTTFASTSLCADSYIQSLVATPQIAALSWQSRSGLSLATTAQKNLPQIRDTPELIAHSRADILVFGPGEGRWIQSRGIYKLARLTGKPMVFLKWGEDIQTLFENSQKILAHGGNPAIVQNWRIRLTALQNRAKARKIKPKVLYLTRSGGSAGANTFMDALIDLNGAHNALDDIGAQGWVTPDPEQILRLQPDLIITSFFTHGYESTQAIALRHQALRRFIAGHPRLDIDGALWPCAGPYMIIAAEQIATALDKLEHTLPPLAK